MRKVSTELAKKLALTKQVKATNSDPKASIWINRPTIPLTNDIFLEKQTIFSNKSISDVSIAVCHPRVNSDNTHIYIAYISNGKLRIVRSQNKASMKAHTWADCSFLVDADSCAIAFDGTMPKNVNGEIEFVTEMFPWVFWTKSGVLYAQQLYSNSEPEILAEKNCTDVSAVRAMWSLGFDFGLCTFFIVNKYLYYRQLIDGIWYDAELINTSSFEPDNSWKSIAANRSWDYRVVLQLKNHNGSIYELYGQFEGLAKQLSEHIEIEDVVPSSKLLPITYYTQNPEEHLEIAEIEKAYVPYGGLYSTAVPIIESIENLPDEDDNWGTTLKVSFNVHMQSSLISENYTSFKMVDSNGSGSREFVPYSSELEEDGLTVTYRFINFNSAIGRCSFVYTPGTVKSMANVNMEEFEIDFYPKNLVNTDYNVPEIIEIWNE